MVSTTFDTYKRQKGVVILFKNKFLQSSNKIIEPGRATLLTLSLQNLNLKILGIYAPNTNKVPFWEKIYNICSHDSPHLVMGDFNINDSELNYFQYSILNLGFVDTCHQQFIDKKSINFTFHKENLNYHSRIDFIFMTPTLSNTIQSKIHTPDLILSPDHNLVTTEIELNVENTTSATHVIPRINLKNLNKQTINMFNNSLFSPSLLLLHDINDLEQQISQKIVQQAIEVFGQFKTPQHHSVPPNTLNLQTIYKILTKAKLSAKHNSHITHQMQKTSNLIYKYKVEIKEMNFNKIDYISKVTQKLKQIKKDINFETRKYYNKQLKSAIEFLQYSPTKSPKVFFQKFNNKNKLTSEINTLKTNDTPTSNQAEINQIIEDFYSNLYKNQSLNPNIKIKPWLRTNHINSVKKQMLNIQHNLTQNISLEELQSTLEKFHKNKAPGPDTIPYEILQNLNKTNLIIILHLFNLILTDETIPKNWKQSTTVLIFKNDDKTNISNYRPITLLNTLYKVYATILNNRISKACDELALIHPNQSGFRKHHNTLQRVYGLIQCIFQAKKSNLPLYILYVDIYKAYDTIPKKGLLEILKFYNFPIKIINLINNIYTDTNTRVWTNNQFTNTIAIERGVRQGCPLSPLLFSIFLNPLLFWIQENCVGFKYNSIEHLLSAFADDMSFTTQDENNMNKVLYFISKFNSYYNIQLNVKDSTKTTIASLNIINRDFFIFQNNQNIKIPTLKSNESYKYLGIKLNTNLSWESNLSEINITIQKILAALKHSSFSAKQIVFGLNKILMPILAYKLVFIRPPDKWCKTLDNKLSQIIYNKLYLKSFNSPHHLHLPENLSSFNLFSTHEHTRAASIKFLTNNLQFSKDPLLSKMLQHDIHTNGFAFQLLNASKPHNLVINYKSSSPKPPVNCNITVFNKLDLWTDGSSKHGEGKYATYSSTLSLVAKTPHYFPQDSLTAEILAIHQATQLAKLASTSNIFTDSESALLLIKKNHHKSILSKVLQEIVQNIKRHNITLYHIPSHSEHDNAKLSKLKQKFPNNWNIIQRGNINVDNLLNSPPTHTENLDHLLPVIYFSHMKSIYLNKHINKCFTDIVTQKYYILYPKAREILLKTDNSILHSLKHTDRLAQNFAFKLLFNKLPTKHHVNSTPHLLKYYSQKTNFYASSACPLGCQVPETTKHMLNCPRNIRKPLDIMSTITGIGLPPQLAISLYTFVKRSVSTSKIHNLAGLDSQELTQILNQHNIKNQKTRLFIKKQIILYTHSIWKNRCILTFNTN